jgi:membrane protein required for colicin V production
MFNWADYIILAVIGLSIIISFVRGFVREALSLVIWALAFWVAFVFARPLASLEFMTSLIHADSLRTIAAFVILIVITLLIGALINFLIAQLIDKTGLSGTDRILGVVFGCSRGVLLIAVLLMLGSLTPAPKEAVWWKDSVLIPHFQPIQVWLRDVLPSTVKEHLVLTY